MDIITTWGQLLQIQSNQVPVQTPGGKSDQVTNQGQQIIQSKIVQHNGRTYLVQVRAQKPLDPGKQIVIRTNQPGIGGSGLVQEVMDANPGGPYKRILREQHNMVI